MRPVLVRPIIDRSSAFHRPVWFGSMPGRSGVNVVVEIDRAENLAPRRGVKRSPKNPVRRRRCRDDRGRAHGRDEPRVHPDFVRNRSYFIKLHSPRGSDRLAVHVIERKASEDGLRDSGSPSKLLLKIPVFSESTTEAILRSALMGISISEWVIPARRAIRKGTPRTLVCCSAKCSASTSTAPR